MVLTKRGGVGVIVQQLLLARVAKKGSLICQGNQKEKCDRTEKENNNKYLIII